MLLEVGKVRVQSWVVSKMNILNTIRLCKSFKLYQIVYTNPKIYSGIRIKFIALS